MKGKMEAMDNNYKAYVQKYHSIDNPETDALLERLRTIQQTNSCNGGQRAL